MAFQDPNKGFLMSDTMVITASAQVSMEPFFSLGSGRRLSRLSSSDGEYLEDKGKFERAITKAARRSKDIYPSGI